jgi:hypothetical protein
MLYLTWLRLLLAGGLGVEFYLERIHIRCYEWGIWSVKLLNVGAGNT